MTTDAAPPTEGPELAVARPGETQPRRVGGRALVIAVLVLFVVVGVALRIWALGREPINSDEAVVGLMAREILRGHFSAFYWGQNYGGGEPYVVAAVFAVLGQSRFTLGFTPVMLDALAAVLTWRIGRRLFGERVGIAAAVLFWVFPEVYIWQSTIEYGFRWLTLDCGLVVALESLRRSARAPARLGAALDWLILGLAAGVGWWASPEIVYYLVPSAAILALAAFGRKLEERLGDLAACLIGAAVGALPWLWTNLPHGFVSLRSGSQPDPSFAHHMNVLRDHVLPTLLGLQLPVSGKWLFGHLLGDGLEDLAIALGVVYLIVLARRRTALFFVIFLVLFPFVYAASPFTWYWQDGRYAVYLAPMLAIGLVAGADELAHLSFLRPYRRTLLPAAAPLALGLALTLLGASEFPPFAPDHVVGSPAETWTSWYSDPNGYLATLDRAIEAEGVHRVFAGYWMAYSMAFESRGALVVSDARYSRYAPYLADLESGPPASWLFVDASARRRLATLSGSGSVLLDPACAVAGDTCLTANMFEVYLHEEAIPYVAIPFDALGVVLVHPKAAVSAGAVIAHYHLGARP